MSKTDISLAESLAKLVNDQNLAEIEYDTEGLRLRVVRTATTAFAPARCPCVRDNPLCFAQRPLPSIMTATCVGIRPESVIKPA